MSRTAKAPVVQYGGLTGALGPESYTSSRMADVGAIRSMGPPNERLDRESVGGSRLINRPSQDDVRVERRCNFTFVSRRTVLELGYV